MKKDVTEYYTISDYSDYFTVPTGIEAPSIKLYVDDDGMQDNQVRAKINIPSGVIVKLPDGESEAKITITPIQNKSSDCSIELLGADLLQITSIPVFSSVYHNYYPETANADYQATINLSGGKFDTTKAEIITNWTCSSGAFEISSISATDTTCTFTFNLLDASENVVFKLSTTSTKVLLNPPSTEISFETEVARYYKENPTYTINNQFLITGVAFSQTGTITLENDQFLSVDDFTGDYYTCSGEGYSYIKNPFLTVVRDNDTQLTWTFSGNGANVFMMGRYAYDIIGTLAANCTHAFKAAQKLVPASVTYQRDPYIIHSSSPQEFTENYAQTIYAPLVARTICIPGKPQGTISLSTVSIKQWDTGDGADTEKNIVSDISNPPYFENAYFQIKNTVKGAMYQKIQVEFRARATQTVGSAVYLRVLVDKSLFPFSTEDKYFSIAKMNPLATPVFQTIVDGVVYDSGSDLPEYDWKNTYESQEVVFRVIGDQFAADSPSINFNDKDDSSVGISSYFGYVLPDATTDIPIYYNKNRTEITFITNSSLALNILGYPIVPAFYIQKNCLTYHPDYEGVFCGFVFLKTVENSISLTVSDSFTVLGNKSNDGSFVFTLTGDRFKATNSAFQTFLSMTNGYYHHMVVWSLPTASFSENNTVLTVYFPLNAGKYLITSLYTRGFPIIELAPTDLTYRSTSSETVSYYYSKNGKDAGETEVFAFGTNRTFLKAKFDEVVTYDTYTSTYQQDGTTRSTFQNSSSSALSANYIQIRTLSSLGRTISSMTLPEAYHLQMKMKILQNSTDMSIYEVYPFSFWHFAPNITNWAGTSAQYKAQSSISALLYLYDISTDITVENPETVETEKDYTEGEEITTVLNLTGTKWREDINTSDFWLIPYGNYVTFSASLKNITRNSDTQVTITWKIFEFDRIGTIVPSINPSIWIYPFSSAFQKKASGEAYYYEPVLIAKGKTGVITS